MTDLHDAITKSGCGTVRRLINEGADVNEQSNSGDTALHTAVDHGYVGSVEVLLDHQADVNFRNWDGATALDLAEYKLGELEEIIALLTQHGEKQCQ